MHRLFNRYTCCLYLTLVVLLVVLPLNSEGSLNDITVLYIRSDYLLHIVLFLPWVFFYRAFRIHMAWWALYGILFASATEAVQYLLPYRAFNINDMVANNAGILLGMILIMIFPQKRHSDKNIHSQNHHL